MKNLLTTLAGLLIISSTVFAQPIWSVDPAHAKVTFSTVHNTISDVEGLFNSFQAKVIASKEDFSDAVFELTINVESIDTEVKMRDDHLKSPDFFDVQKYPMITFKSTSIVKAKDKGRYTLTGNLTIHGVTKTVNMDLWYRGTIKDTNTNKRIAGFQVSGTVNRSAFDIGQKFPESLISDVVIIKADGEFIL